MTINELKVIIEEAYSPAELMERLDIQWEDIEYSAMDLFNERYDELVAIIQEDNIWE